jgi:tetratricopeptide (TPR) repeat protein
MQHARPFIIIFAALLSFAALTAWFAWKTIKKSEDPARMIFKWILSGVVLIILVFVGLNIRGMGYAGAFIGPIVAAIFGIGLGILWAPHLGALIAKPFTSLYDDGDAQAEVRPLYSIARAKVKRGLYQAAIAEVQKQLERFPTDYEGWILLAEIHGENLENNAEAQRCVNEILSHEGHSPRNLVYALNRSADWHLELASDRDAARQSLEEIVQRFPGSEFAHTAAQRLAHLTTDRMLADQRERPTIALVHRDEHIGLQGKVADPRPEAEEPSVAAARLVRHLQSYPEDVDAREQLATLYADHYGRIDLASDQIEQLIALPGVAQKEVVRWLNMLVDFHVRVDQDREAARGVLHRIMESFPKTAVASLAESRLGHLEGEFRRNTKSQVMKLGSYEDKIGLKGNVPKKPG